MDIPADTPPLLSKAVGPPPGLSIRATRIDDVEGVTVLSNLPGFRSGTLRLPYQKAERTRQWLETRSGDDLNIVAVLNGLVVGQAGLERHKGRRAHVASLGMGVHDDHCGRGIGTALLAEVVDAADNWLSLKRLELTVYTDNAPAIRLYKKFGFESEGLRRSFAFKAGRYVDALGMSRLRF